MSTFRIKPIAACCALLGVVAAAVHAQPQAQAQPLVPPPHQVQPPAGALPPDIGPGNPPPAGQAAEQTVRGAVRSYLLTPAGEVDGLLLDDGTQVDVPPHLSSQLTRGVHVHDRIEVTGVRAPASPLVRATQIKDPVTSAVVRVDGPPLATPPARAAVAPALAPMTATGRIVALLYTPRGDVGGVLTQDGTQVQFPPQAEAGHGLAIGKALYARGFGTQGPNGRAMEATAVGSNAGDAQAVFSPPAPRPGMPPPPGGPSPDGSAPMRIDAGPPGVQTPAPLAPPGPPRPLEATATAPDR